VTDLAEHKNVSEQQARELAEESRQTEWRQPSFGKELFLGRFRLDLIHPHPRPDDDDVARGEEYLAKLEAFLREKIDPIQIERDAKIPDDVVKGLAELGTFGIKIDRKYGGLGLSQLYYNKALALFSMANPSLVALVSAHQSIGVPQPLKLAGTDEQKAEYLPRCAKGAVSAFLLTEPDVGSDPARMAATAVPDGDHYVLNGTKLWATNGTIAELYVVMARVPKSEGHRGGITAFVVESSWPGIEIARRNSFMGLRGIENGLIKFHDVRVPAANVIGDEGAGLRIALATLNTGRLSIPATCAASARWSLKMAREWGSSRVQWGQPVAKHEAMAMKVAYMAAMAFGLEAVVDLSSLLSDEGRSDIRIEAALAKLYCSEHAWQLADDLLQLRGGRGFETAESLMARGERPIPAEQQLRDLRINRIFEGSSEIMRLFIAREAVDTHLQVAGDIIDPKKPAGAKARAAARAGGFYAKWLPTLAVGAGQMPRAYAEFGPLAEHLRYVERHSRKLARATFLGMSRWQGKLERKQGFLGRLVDIGAELFAMSAAVVRARMIAEDTPDDAKAARELADLFCRQARRRVDRLFHELWHNEDTREYKATVKVLNGEYEFLEHDVLDLSPDLPWVATE
jgi:alkylation response protein AidB-like acyl-CoA dehydrogenase